MAALNEQTPRVNSLSAWLDQGEVIPHVLTFGSILNQVSETYSYRWDEAIRHLPRNALAMRRDCFIRALLQERALSTANCSWQLQPENPGDHQQQFMAECLTMCLHRLPRWHRFIKYMLEALWYGRYGAQIRWVLQPVAGVARWLVDWHRPVNGDKIQYRWDGTPAVFINARATSLYPQDVIAYTDRVPALALTRPAWRQQFIIHSHEVDDADYFEGEMAGAVEGVGLRTMIYWAWWLRDELLSWAIDFMKKVGTLGLLIFPYEMSNKDSKAKAEANAQAASHNVALTMPVVLSANPTNNLMPMQIAANTSGIEALRHMIESYFEAHMERLIIGQTLSANSEGRGLGGSGVALLHADTKFQLVKFDAENLAATLTTDLVEPMRRLNFPHSTARIRFQFNVESPDNATKLEAVQRASSLGVRFDADEIRRLTGIRKSRQDTQTNPPGNIAAGDPGLPPGGI